MLATKEFQLWLRIQLGQVMAWESQLQIPDSEIKVEIRRGGQWVPVSLKELQ